MRPHFLQPLAVRQQVAHLVRDVRGPLSVQAELVLRHVRNVARFLQSGRIYIDPLIIFFLSSVFLLVIRFGAIYLSSSLVH